MILPMAGLGTILLFGGVFFGLMLSGSRHTQPFARYVLFSGVFGGIFVFFFLFGLPFLLIPFMPDEGNGGILGQAWVLATLFSPVLGAAVGASIVNPDAPRIFVRMAKKAIQYVWNLA